MAVKAADFLRWVLGVKEDVKDNPGSPTSLARFLYEGDKEILNPPDILPGEEKNVEVPERTAGAGATEPSTTNPCQIIYRLDSEYRGQNTGQRPTRDFTLDGSIIRARRYWVEMHHWYINDETSSRVFSNGKVIELLENASDHLYNRIGHHGEVIYDFDETGKIQYKGASRNFFSRISVIDIPPLVDVTIPT